LVSAAIHILVFGGALAFAQYTGAFFRTALPVITVSLVGGGGGNGAIRRAGPEKLSAAPSHAPRGDSPNIIEPAMNREETSASSAEETRTGAGAHAVAEFPGGGAEAGPPAATGSQDGIVQAGSAFSSEQWQRLHDAIEKAKTYPRLARERGVEGVVLVRFKVAPSGKIEKVDVVKSSGSDILDQASIRTVQRAAPMPYLNGWVEVPMSYILK
jgi:TonB family protein